MIGLEELKEKKVGLKRDGIWMGTFVFTTSKKRNIQKHSKMYLLPKQESKVNDFWFRYEQK